MSPSGVDPSAIRQLLLQHMFLPLVSVQSTHNADVLFQRECGNSLLSVLQVFKPYANNAKYGVPNQAFRITNTQLISRTYGLFPVRFEPSMPELLTVHNLADDKLKALFSISSLEQLMGKLSRDQPHDPARADELLYFNMFRKVITSNRVILFDTLNHPVAQVFVIDFEKDSIETVRQLVVEFRNFAFPKYFQLTDLLIHVFIAYDSQLVNEADLAKFQAALRNQLSIVNTAVPLNQYTLNEKDTVKLSKLENMTIDEEVQFQSFLQSTEAREDEHIDIPRALDTVLRGRFHEFISKHLIPHMETKIRTWDDLILAPKKSITGRFFSVSRKLFNNNSNDLISQGTSLGSYNHQGNYYHRSSPEQAIRKLADWSLMLKDYKYAYSTYDIIKKDYTNDKAWMYVASAQEMCIVSLLLAQTQPLASDMMPIPPDKNTLRKIRHDIIEPYVDNLSYTFKSRFNVKTYAIRSYFIVTELLLNMSVMFSIPWWWSDLVENYYLKIVNEIDTHLGQGNEGALSTRAILFERLGYAKSRSSFIPGEFRELVDRRMNTAHTVKSREEGHYENIAKMKPPRDNSVKGLTRDRRSMLWYLLAMREWLQLKNAQQIKKTMTNISAQFSLSEVTEEWYDRGDLILAKLKTSILL